MGLHREAPLTTLSLQIDRYAQRDLKKGLHLYGTPGNVGLTNAWSIIQTDVRGGRWTRAWGGRLGGRRRGGWGVAGPVGRMCGVGPSARSRPVPPAVPLLWRLQLHGLVRGVQCHARARLLLPGVQ